MSSSISRKRLARTGGATAVVVALPAAGGTAVAGTAPRSAAPDASPAGTASFLGLDGEERLVVRDVVKDADGTTHTRYDRTYGGLPVLAYETVFGGVQEDGTRGNHRTVDLDNKQSGPGTLFTDSDDIWGDGAATSRQTAAVDAAYGFAKTHDFYKNVLGRDGIRNDGAAPTSYVHYGVKHANAYYDDDTFSLYYGDGADGKHPLTQLDVAGHEFTHGVTDATARLVYGGESGGLDEATSDIFGTAIEFGVANHFFYLLAEGSGVKTINGVRHESRTKDGSTVTGIGREKAVKIWYKALTSYFTSTTTYAAARRGTVQAATDLYGANSTEVAAVKAAWTGVDVKG